MTLSDDDKQFIKDAINYRMKNGSNKSYSSDTESGKKLSKMELDEREKKNRELLLKELQERDKKGENTIAQKVEMLNLSMKSAIPDDFKEAMQITGKNIKNGANQAMSGLTHLTDRAMMSNPLTAMIWQNRDIIQALGDVGIGSVKAVGGAIGGIGRGAAGLLNASTNMFKRTKRTEVIPADVVPEYSESKASKQSEEEEIIVQESTVEKSDDSMAQKINEIHNYIFKQQPKEKREQERVQNSHRSILSKGLTGLGKSIKAVNTIIEVIQAKQKLILTGVMVGAAAIIGLATWFKSGGLTKALKGVVDSALANAPWNQDKKVQEDIDTKVNDSVADSIDTSILRGKEYKGYLEENKENFTGVAKTTDTGSKNIGGYKTQGRQYTVGNLTPVLAPIDGTINDVKGGVGKLNGGENKMYFSFTLYGKAGQSKDNLTQNVVKLKFENVLNPRVFNGQNVTMQQLLGFADGTFKITQILGNQQSGKQILDEYGSFVNKAKAENWKTAIDTTTKNVGDKEQNKINDTLKNVIDDKNMKQRSTSKYTNGAANLIDRVKNSTLFKSDEDTEKELKQRVASGKSKTTTQTETNTIKPSVKTEEATVPKVTKTVVNNTDQKIQQQNAQIKEQAQKQKPEMVQQTPQKQQAENKIISVNGFNPYSGATLPADVQTTGEARNSKGDYYNIKGL